MYPGTYNLHELHGICSRASSIIFFLVHSLFSTKFNYLLFIEGHKQNIRYLHW